MKQNTIKQFEQIFRMFSSIVKDYDDIAWLEMGHRKTTPYRLSFHILQSIKFYTSDTNDFCLENGKTLKHDYKLSPKKTIGRADILKNIPIIKESVENWIKKLNLKEKNENLSWTGDDMESVVIFIIRHSYFHLGELNALLNEHKEGGAADYFAKNIY